MHAKSAGPGRLRRSQSLLPVSDVTVSPKRGRRGYKSRPARSYSFRPGWRATDLNIIYLYGGCYEVETRQT